MAWTKPTPAQLDARTRGDVALDLSGSEPFIQGTPEYVLAMVMRQLSLDEHDHIASLVNVLLPDGSDPAEEGVTRWGGIFGVARKEAAKATGNVTFTGTNGTNIPDGTLIQTSDGRQYETDGAVTISGGSATANVDALVGGLAGNLAEAAPVTLVTPISGVNSTAAVAAGGLTGGADIETILAWWERILQRIQNPPAGGAAADYERWALEVPGVKKAWVYPLLYGLGTLGVTFIVEGTGSGQIPNGAKVTEVQAYIDARRPITATVTVFAPTALTVNLTIQLEPNTAAVQAAVQAEVDDLFERKARPGSAAGDGKIPHSQIDEAVSLAEGETDHAVTVPSGDIEPTHGQFPVRGTITWQALP